MSIFNTRKDDPALINSIQKVMMENNIRRQVEKVVLEEFGVVSEKALPHEIIPNYRKVLEGFSKEILDEGVKLDEISKERLNSYLDKADDSVKDLAKKGAKWSPGDKESKDKADKSLAKAFKRENFRTLASKKVSGNSTHPWSKPKVLAKEEDQLDEISKERLGKYIKKAAKDLVPHEQEMDYHRDMARKTPGRISDYHIAKYDAHKRMQSNRKAGIEKAADKLTKEETLDEVSKETKAKYFNKAMDQISNFNKKIKQKYDKYGYGYKLDKDEKREQDSAKRRSKGIRHVATGGAEKMVNEISKERAKSYIDDAKVDVEFHKDMVKKYLDKNKKYSKEKKFPQADLAAKAGDYHLRKYMNRSTGIAKAKEKSDK